MSTMQELVLDNTDLLDGGEYQCNISNAAGRDTAMISLNGESYVAAIVAITSSLKH